MGEGLQAKLPPAALEFITDAKPKPMVQTNATPVAPVDAPVVAVSPPPPASVEPSVKLRPQKEVPAEPPSFVHLNIRVTHRIPVALLKASTDRKVRKIKPSTQQEIVDEALTDWLKKHGYLN